MKKSNSLIGLLLILACVLVSTVFVRAANSANEPLDPILEKGIGDYKHENYDEAVISLKKAVNKYPDSTLASYYLGLTYKKLQDYHSAIQPLETAVTKTPKIIGALIELIDVYYQTGDLDSAKKWVTKAENAGIRPAQVAFLKGLVYAKAEEPNKAVEAFNDAKFLDKNMGQSCDYQIAILHLKEGEYKEARSSFKEVILNDPNSTMANFANEYVDAISKKESMTRPFKFSVGTSWQYDDNVVLKPSDSGLADSITEQADSREVYTAKAEYNHKFNERFGIRGQYMLYLAKQNDLGFYDTFSNTYVIQPNIYLDNGLLTFPTTYNHTSINDKAYISTPSTSCIYNFMVGKSNMGQASLRYQNKYYFWDPSTPDEDRDGHSLTGGFGWYFFYAHSKGFLNLRYSLNKDWTDGKNWENIGNRVSATVLIPVIDKLNLTLSGDMNLQRFENTHSVFAVKRSDNVYTLSTLVGYKIYNNSELQLQYTFIKDDSNVATYDYNRNIFSAGVEIKF